MFIIFYEFLFIIYLFLNFYKFYKCKSLNVKDPLLAKYLVEKSDNKCLSTKYKDTKSLNKKPIVLTASEWGNVTLELKLPPIYKYIDQRFGKFI